MHDTAIDVCNPSNLAVLVAQPGKLCSGLTWRQTIPHRRTAVCEVLGIGVNDNTEASFRYRAVVRPFLLLVITRVLVSLLVLVGISQVG